VAYLEFHKGDLSLPKVKHDSSLMCQRSIKVTFENEFVGFVVNAKMATSFKKEHSNIVT